MTLKRRGGQTVILARPAIGHTVAGTSSGATVADIALGQRHSFIDNLVPIPSSRVVIHLDSFDRKILLAVQQDNQQPHRAIAHAVSLSVPAVARRLQRLRDDGVIRADVSVVDAAAVGRPLQVIVEVCVESELPTKLDALRQRFANCPQVQQCFYTSGEVDFILTLAVRDMAEYTQLIDELFVAGHNVRSFRSFFALQCVKGSTVIPIDGA